MKKTLIAIVAALMLVVDAFAQGTSIPGSMNVRGQLHVEKTTTLDGATTAGDITAAAITCDSLDATTVNANTTNLTTGSHITYQASLNAGSLAIVTNGTFGGTLIVTGNTRSGGTHTNVGTFVALGNVTLGSASTGVLRATALINSHDNWSTNGLVVGQLYSSNGLVRVYGW